MSGYMAMLCLLPAFLAAITSAFGLRAAYVRSSRAVSVSSEAAAVLLSSEISCLPASSCASGPQAMRMHRSSSMCTSCCSPLPRA